MFSIIDTVVSKITFLSRFSGKNILKLQNFLIFSSGKTVKFFVSYYFATLQKYLKYHPYVDTFIEDFPGIHVQSDGRFVNLGMLFEVVTSTNDLHLEKDALHSRWSQMGYRGWRGSNRI